MPLPGEPAGTAPAPRPKVSYKSFVFRRMPQSKTTLPEAPQMQQLATVPSPGGEGGPVNSKVPDRACCERCGSQRRQRVDGVVVEPAAAFRQRAEKTIDQRSGDAGSKGNNPVATMQRQHRKSNQNHHSSANRSAKSSSQTHGSVSAGRNTPQVGDEARLAAEHLTQFGRNSVRGGFGHGGEHGHQSEPWGQE